MCNEIPAGFQLHINSWENDGDYGRTQIISGLTEADVRFYLDIAENFRSRTGWDKKGHGNGDVDGNILVDLVQTALSNHPDISNSVREIWNINSEEVDIVEDDCDCGNYYELITDFILGLPEEESYGGGCFCRVYDGYRVFFIEKPISDVTKQFR